MDQSQVHLDVEHQPKKQRTAFVVTEDARTAARELLLRIVSKDPPKVHAEEAGGSISDQSVAGVAKALLSIADRSEHSEGKHSSEDSAVLDMLQCLVHEPMTCGILKETQIGRTLNRSCWKKHNNAEVRSLVTDLLTKWRRLTKTQDIHDIASPVAIVSCDLATSIESAVFKECSDPRDYRAKVRQLVATLRRNGSLHSRLLQGDLSPQQFVQCSEEQLLTDGQLAMRRTHLRQSLEKSLNSNLALGAYVLGIDCTGENCHEECERRHLDPRECKRKEWPNAGSIPQSTRLIICAGPERSGSTWLYNAVRLLHLFAQVPCDGYWLASLTQEKLEERLKTSPPAVVLVKTHDWFPEYPDLLKTVSLTSQKILLTHRDLRGVCASYRRVKWEIGIPDRYVEDHMCWRQYCSLDIAYEDLVRDGVACLRRLASHIGLAPLSDHDFCAVSQELQSLKRCHMGNAVCQITKLWPNHMSGDTRRLQGIVDADVTSLNKFLDPSYSEVLNARFQNFQKTYGYI